MSLTGLVFVVAFFVGCGLSFARHPIYGLMTYMAVLYLHPPSRWWGSALPDLRWSLLAALVTLCSYLMLQGRLKRMAMANPGTVPVSPTVAISIFDYRFFIGLLLFILWLAAQSLWALDISSHLTLLTLYAKYALLLVMIYKCVDSEQHLRYFFWTHVAGCFYLGWIVYTTYTGGRFEHFGGPDFDEANAGAMQVATGIMVAAALFLTEKWRGRAVLIGLMPFMVNALVATISRSGFLALASGGLMFNFFTPKKFRWGVRVLSVLALVLFILLTNPVYWLRIASLTQAGEEVEGVDTGTSRIEVARGQWEMFKLYPMGCGHRCTVVLSPKFIAAELLDLNMENPARSSHNTFMSLLVEQGVPGVIFYLLMLIWLFKNLWSLWRSCRGKQTYVATTFPAVAAVLAAVTIGDMFVDYLKSEVRLWFIAILMVMLSMAAAERKQAAASAASQPDQRNLREAVPSARGVATGPAKPSNAPSVN